MHPHNFTLIMVNSLAKFIEAADGTTGKPCYPFFFSQIHPTGHAAKIVKSINSNTSLGTIKKIQKNYSQINKKSNNKKKI